MGWNTSSFEEINLIKKSNIAIIFYLPASEGMNYEKRCLCPEEKINSHSLLRIGSLIAGYNLEKYLGMAMAEVRIETIVSPSVSDLRTPPHDSSTHNGKIKNPALVWLAPRYIKFAFGG